MAVRDSNSFDLILIGSGMGALTVASLMSRLRRKRVLVLERHFRPGGFTHAFRRGRFSWDVGLHYVGEMAPGSRTRQLFDLVTAGQVQWTAMPDPFDVFHYPDLEFRHPVGGENLRASLTALFPAEGRAIRRYLRDVNRAANAFALPLMRRNASAAARGISALAGIFQGHWWKHTTRDYLDAAFRDSKLKALLASQWGDYGLPPSQSPFPLHALIARHYFHGGYYPVGGAERIAAAVKSTVESQGGAIRVSRDVVRILVENGRACGVVARTRRGTEEEYHAPVVVSNAGAVVTYTKLLQESVNPPFRAELLRFVGDHPPVTHVSLYVGFRDDPRRLGFQGENHWLFRGYDHDAAYARRAAWIASGEPDEVYLSFPSLKNPEATAHTAELIAFTDYAPFEHWRSQPWRKRDRDYQSLKQRLTEGLVHFVETRHPGFADLIEYSELSTPLTNEFMTGHHRGGIYGVPAVRSRFTPERQAWTHPRSPVPGLYLTGSDVGILGILGAVMGGLTTLGHLPDGISLPGVFQAAARAQSRH